MLKVKKNIFSKLNSAKYFSTLELQAGYHHIPLYDVSIPKTAFMSPFRKYEYLKVPLGLAQAPANFQELMNKILKDLPFAIVYLDNMSIYSKITEDHLQNAKLSMKLSKCHFFAKEIQC